MESSLRNIRLRCKRAPCENGRKLTPEDSALCVIDRALRAHDLQTKPMASCEAIVKDVPSGRFHGGIVC